MTEGVARAWVEANQLYVNDRDGHGHTLLYVAAGWEQFSLAFLIFFVGREGGKPTDV